jgi:NADH-quinone oxidoreductase subunit C
MPDETKSATPPEGEKPAAEKTPVAGGEAKPPAPTAAPGVVNASVETPPIPAPNPAQPATSAQTSSAAGEKSGAAPGGDKPAVPAEKAPAAAAAEAKPAAAAAKPAAPAGEKPAAPAAKPAAPAKPAGPVPVPWDTPMVEKLKRRYGSGLEAQTYLGQNYIRVDRSLIPDILRLLRDEEQFDYCVDITAVHYPKRERQFDMVWILYSFAKNERMRVKTEIKDGESIPSSVPIWTTANWLERETYDMFGIKFDGHPDMKRILLPDGWKGHPLRKDYGIIQQDQEWVQINLGIDSGQ